MSVSRFRLVMEITSTVCVVVASTAVVWAVLRRPASEDTRRRVPIPAASVSFRDAQTLGRATAPVVILGFSDFQCPACASFVRKTFPDLKRKYLLDTGKVLFAFMHLPLDIHERAQQAAEAAECAGKQGRFWEMHDWLFQNPTTLDSAGVQRAAAQIAVSASSFTACMKGEMTRRVSSAKELARTLRISGTPTFFIGSKVTDTDVRVSDTIGGAATIDAFEAPIEALLRR